MNKELKIRRLGKSDVGIFKEMIQLFQEVFEEEKQTKIEELYLEKLLEKPGFMVYCAISNGEVVGGLTAYELPMYYSKHSEIFIYDIAIKAEFQRKGVGRKLLSSLQVYGKKNNIEVIFVAVNEEDKHALDFYHSTGGKAEKVVHFNYDLDE